MLLTITKNLANAFIILYLRFTNLDRSINYRTLSLKYVNLNKQKLKLVKINSIRVTPDQLKFLLQIYKSATEVNLFSKGTTNKHRP